MLSSSVVILDEDRGLPSMTPGPVSVPTVDERGSRSGLGLPPGSKSVVYEPSALPPRLARSVLVGKAQYPELKSTAYPWMIGGVPVRSAVVKQRADASTWWCRPGRQVWWQSLDDSDYCAGHALQADRNRAIVRRFWSYGAWARDWVSCEYQSGLAPLRAAICLIPRFFGRLRLPGLHDSREGREDVAGST